MIPSSMPAAAELLARAAHAGQIDKGGSPYIEHCRRVAESVAGEGPACVAAAWLHDVIEDTHLDAADLRIHGFPVEVVEAVEALTKQKGEAYFTGYLLRVKGNPIARQVKLADLSDNSNLDRIPNPGERDYQRCRKYHRATQLLMAPWP